eukprot:763992-Rhodomonas_salina.1
MEFDQRMDVARRSHRECVGTMKSFWKHVAKRRRATSHDATERVRTQPEFRPYADALLDAMTGAAFVVWRDATRCIDRR